MMRWLKISERVGRWAFEPAEVEDILRRAEAGESLRTIAAAYSITRGVVARVLHQHSVVPAHLLRAK